MMTMPHRSARLAALALAGATGLVALAAPARAGILYRCKGPDGSIAYTNKASAFSDCKVLSRYDDAPSAKAPAHHAAKKRAEHASAKPASAPARPAPVAAAGWRYEENPSPEKPDVRATEFGIESTAALVRSPAKAISAGTMIAKAETPDTAPATPKPRILRGAVYRVQRANGITEYTNLKPTGAQFSVLFTYIATCIACDVHSKIDFAHTPLNLDAYKDEIAAAATDYGVDASLLRAVIHAESAFNPMAVSAKGAQGLMQLMPGTAGELGVTNAFDVAQNISGGAKYLAQLLKDFNGNIQLAAAAYNAGESAVQKYGGVPPYDETQVYVQRVETLRDRYQKAL